MVGLGDVLGLSLAYVDRQTFGAHLERALTGAEWAQVNDEFRAMDFDDHVGDSGRCRTEWIDAVLAKAGVDPDQPQTDPADDTAGHVGHEVTGGRVALVAVPAAAAGAL